MKRHHVHPDTSLAVMLTFFVCLLVGFLLSYYQRVSPERGYFSCPEEMMLCPDGSVSLRVGPQCQFSPCTTPKAVGRPGITEEPFLVTPSDTPKKPTVPPVPPKDEVLCTQEVKACPDGSFVGKFGPRCEFAPCPDILEYESDH